MNKAKSGFKNLLPILLILLIGGIGVQTFTSCSSDESDEEQPSNSGGSSSSTGGDGGGASSSGGSGGGSSSSADGGGGGSSSSVGGGNHFNPNITYGSLIDSRNNKTYKTVVIGDQTWMAENLNYDVPNNTTDVCYDNNPDNCATYGRLYDWLAAMAIEDTIYYKVKWNGSDVKRQGVCPTGWYLPSRADWDALVTTVGGESNSGTKLKARNGWNSVPGTDDYGFSALPGGRWENNNFSSINSRGNWWSATEGSNTSANYKWMSGDAGFGTNVHNNANNKSYLYYVRCLKDDGNGQGGGSSSSGNPSGSWCVDHGNSECTNDPYLTSSQEICATWLGILEDSCPAGYDRRVYSGSWCVDHGNEECTDNLYLTSSPENCADWLGVLADSCPAGYDYIYVD